MKNIQWLLAMLLALALITGAAVADEVTTPSDLTNPPVSEPTQAPTQAPTSAPTQVPTSAPTQAPTSAPTQAPTSVPTQVPTSAPTQAPTSVPTQVPTSAPTQAPTSVPTQVPTSVPTQVPTSVPTQVPTAKPSIQPVSTPTFVPAVTPTYTPTAAPTAIPTAVPAVTATPEATPVATEAPEWQPIATATPVPAQQPVIDQQAQYRCTNHMPFRLMAEPTYQSDQVAMVEKTGVSMVVYEWGETWCLVSCEGLAGYASTNALYAFSRMSDLPLPGYHTCTGIAVLAGKVTLANSSFESNVLPVGTILAVENAEGTVPVYRETGVLPEGVYSYVPFVAAEDAQPGDLLYAFTTFYNYESGGRYAEERRFNIELACQRMHVVLQSGETFSFNDRSGVYADRSGYVNAPNLSLSDVEIGGGVGQVVATIYNAVLGLPLRIDETHVNRASGVAYVPVNLDACVTETRDFRFTNTLPYTIELQVLPQNGALTAFVYCSAMDQ